MILASKLKSSRTFARLFYEEDEIENFVLPRVLEIRWFIFFNCLAKIVENFGLIKAVFQKHPTNNLIIELTKILNPKESSTDFDYIMAEISILKNHLKLLNNICKFFESNEQKFHKISKYIKAKNWIDLNLMDEPFIQFSHPEK